jgi:tRNA threonylcarbamoyl adenosine modification protein YjeE
MADRLSAGERTLPLPDEAATTRLAEDLATILRPGDVIRLEGDLGAGKTSFARAVIRTFADDAMLEVPSPTFTLVQSYEFLRLGISHFDLYRLGGADDLDEIGFDDAIRSGAALIEWPERAEEAIPRDALTLRLDPGPDVGARIARLSGPADWMARLDRTLAIRALLADNGWGDAARRHVKADASARSIERARRASDTRILMNHPPETDDVAGRTRRAARAAAKLAENSHAFVAIARGLRDRGFSAPRIDAHDGRRGLVLMEDFGDAFIAAEGQPIAGRYMAAVEVLADLHGQSLPRALPDGAGSTYVLPEYDLGDLLVQLEPFLDWAMPHLLQRAATSEERTSFVDAWRPHLAEILDAPKTWALRDYHSPNLMWLPDRTGIARVGLLDFQDAVLLHPAYDLASVAQDARVTISPELETALVAHYVHLRTSARADFDVAAFERAYAVLAVQRATRILGIFARLANRDGRPDYLVHYPRILAYLHRTLQAPGLDEIHAWMERHAGVVLTPFR